MKHLVPSSFRKNSLFLYISVLVVIILMVSVFDLAEAYDNHSNTNTSNSLINNTGDFTLHSPNMVVTNFMVSSESNGTYYMTTSTASITNLSLLSNIYGKIVNISTPSAYGTNIKIWAKGYTTTIYEAGVPVTVSNTSFSAVGITIPYSGTVTAVTIWGIYMATENLTMTTTNITLS